jgi:tRNA (guanine-N7-)-methyltransferase
VVPTPKYLNIIEQRTSALRNDLDRILATRRDFVLEVGSGHGHFLTAYAAAHPEKQCVGIDLISERIDRARRKCVRAKLTNLHFIQAEARLFLATLPKTAVLSEIFVLFPDPWPKLRHNKHRIIQPAFLEAAARCAKPECPLFFRTDFTPYFEEASKVVAESGAWTISAEPWPFEFVTVFQKRADAFHSLIARRKMPATSPVSASSARTDQ